MSDIRLLLDLADDAPDHWRAVQQWAERYGVAPLAEMCEIRITAIETRRRNAEAKTRLDELFLGVQLDTGIWTWRGSTRYGGAGVGSVMHLVPSGACGARCTALCGQICVRTARVTAPRRCKHCDMAMTRMVVDHDVDD